MVYRISGRDKAKWLKYRRLRESFSFKLEITDREIEKYNDLRRWVSTRNREDLLNYLNCVAPTLLGPGYQSEFHLLKDLGWMLDGLQGGFQQPIAINSYNGLVVEARGRIATLEKR